MKFPFRSSPTRLQARDTGTHIQLTNPWHAVAVRSTRGACPACKALGGVRFLSSAAPTLPVAGCTQPAVCRSVYQHFDDRREGPRRVTEQVYGGTSAAPPAGRERRAGRGRRATDGYRW